MTNDAPLPDRDDVRQPSSVSTVEEAQQRAALQMVATWMGQRFYRTFRVFDDPAGPFDGLLQQRDRRIGVTTGLLWDTSAPVPGVDALADALTAEMRADDQTDDGAYAAWIPPRVAIPTEEPAASALRVALGHGLRGLEPGERREVRLPVTVMLAKIQDEGAYMSVSGGLSPEWLALSEGIPGAYHLDSRGLYRLPEERAEIDILVSRVRDHTPLLQPEQVVPIELHDHWLVSRLDDAGPPGVTVFAQPNSVDPMDGTTVRRLFRPHVTRAVEQRNAARTAGEAPDLSVLVVVAAVAHLKDELVTASLRGMNPATYGALDLIVLVADGQVRQVLQPRSLPWEQPQEERAP